MQLRSFPIVWDLAIAIPNIDHIASIETTSALVLVSQLLVSHVILEATFDLTQTFMRLSLGSCYGFVFPIWQELCA